MVNTIRESRAEQLDTEQVHDGQVHGEQVHGEQVPDKQAQTTQSGAYSNRTMLLTMIFSAIFRRRSRAIMAVIATLVGSATLFCLAAVCIVVPQQIEHDMRSYGANLIVRAHGSGASAHDVQVIQRDVEAIGHASSATYRYETVRIHAAPYVLAGIDSAAVQAINHHWSVDGAWPSQGRVMIGADIAQSLNMHVGSTITIGYHTTNILDTSGTRFQVSGIVSTGGSEDSMIYATSHDVAQLAGSRGVDVIEFSVDADADTLFSMSQAIAAQDGLSVPVSAQQVSRLTSSNARIITMLQTLFWMVSLVVLALTLVGVSTTMASMVSQRRNEIGLRKALGASSIAIGMEFCIEAVVYGCIGSLLGIGVGQAVANALCNHVFQQSVSFNPLLAVITVCAAIALDIIACIPPVRRAATIDPAVVLREE